MGLSREEAPYQSIPLNTVVELTPQTYGCLETRTTLQRRLSVPVDQAVPAGLSSDGQDEIIPGRSSLEMPLASQCAPAAATPAARPSTPPGSGVAAETPTPQKFNTATPTAKEKAECGAQSPREDHRRELSFDITDPPSV